jgi:hypothetical protein
VTDMRDVVGRLSVGRQQGDVLGAVSAISLRCRLRGGVGWAFHPGDCTHKVAMDKFLGFYDVRGHG